MEHSIDKIQSKQSDYKLCKDCFKLNWYENENCIVCDSNQFSKNHTIIRRIINQEIRFWKKEYIDYTYDDVSQIKIEV